MATEESSFIANVKNFIEELLALKISEAERPQYVKDPYNVFHDDISGRKPFQVASTLSVLFHILLFLIVFPSFGSQVFLPTQEVLVLKQLARPAALAGGGNRPEAAPPKPKPTVPKPKPEFIPIPDPTPNAPEPIRKKEIEEIPRIQEEIAADLNIGDITAPPGPPARGGRGQGRTGGSGSGPLDGAGPGTGAGGIYTIGSGVTMPQILVQTIPTYTDDAIKGKVQGIVILQAIIRKNGRVDSFRVLRGLGYGLEEKAIQEIATNWRFRPGTFNGQPVDVLATIEVQFNLR
ncbi:energy transducer TonB [Acidobacteria bacterium AH-259-L09]|nr:energy transducer TonB [Acidobacteria bacterium AH-259-L09]